MNYCDFCHEENPNRPIRCADFEVVDVVPNVTPMVSTGHFLACETCYQLVREEDREALYTRAKESFIRRHLVKWNPIADKQLKMFFEQFWENRVYGPR